MIVLFWFPGLWIAYGAFLLAIILALSTESFERPRPRRTVKGRRA